MIRFVLKLSIAAMAATMFFAASVSAQHLTLLPDSADFGHVLVGGTSEVTVIAINASDTAITIDGGRIGESPYFHIIMISPIEAMNPPFELAPGDSVVATIQFSPDSVGPFSGSFNYTYSTGVQQEYALNGMGTSNQAAVQAQALTRRRCTIQPNPAALYVDVIPQAPFDSRSVIELRDIFGRVLKNVSLHSSGNEGIGSVHLPCNDINPGSYTITESTGKETIVLGTVAIIH